MELPLPAFALVHYLKGEILSVYVFDDTPAGFKAAVEKAVSMGKTRGADLKPVFTKQIYGIAGRCSSPQLKDKSFLVLQKASQ